MMAKSKSKPTRYTLDGSCLCGSVQYKIKAEFEAFYFCHCGQCRKLIDTTFTADLLAKTTEVKQINGEYKARHYTTRAKGPILKYFAMNASPLPFLNKCATILFIPAGSVDAPLGFTPTDNLFWGAHAPLLEKVLIKKASSIR